MLGTDSLAGRTFLDIGSGSGLFSLAARRLGARVYSFDYDPNSVACTAELRKRYDADGADWAVTHGSVLDRDFVAGLGTFDVVYSWGVLHHTGRMWDAIDTAARAVADGGLFFIAIYNDQGVWSNRWRRIKQMYCSGPAGRAAVLATYLTYTVGRGLVADLVWGRNPLSTYLKYRERRGMSFMHDVHDWLGGYPFEVARPEAIFDFCTARGFRLLRMNTQGGTLACNEFVFRREG
jgi:2-polyprenyl-6-hydroxyphenyl methylase/3-demethylubiquinone-9 3-methyltransferase